MKTQNKLLVVGAILAIVLLSLIAYWAYDTRKVTQRIEARVMTIEAMQSLRLLRQMLGLDDGCRSDYDLYDSVLRTYDPLWAEELDQDYYGSGSQ